MALAPKMKICIVVFLQEYLGSKGTALLAADEIIRLRFGMILLTEIIIVTLKPVIQTQ